MHNLKLLAQIDRYGQSTPRTMISKLSRSIASAIAITSLLTIFCQRSYGSERLPTLSRSPSGISIAQNPSTPTPEQIDRQRDAERVLKQGENLKREIRDNGSDPGNTQRQVDDQINKVRESESDPQKVRAAEAELTRIRQQNNRYYYDPYYSTPGQIIFSPWYGTTPPVTAQDRDTGSGSRHNAQMASSTQVFGTAGFTGGGVTYSLSDSMSIGLGYHSVRGVNVRLGVNF